MKMTPTQRIGHALIWIDEIHSRYCKCAHEEDLCDFCEIRLRLLP